MVRLRRQHSGLGASGGRPQPSQLVSCLCRGRLALDYLWLALDKSGVSRRQLKRDARGGAEAAGDASSCAASSG
eukprot:7391606-Prymnesium_polylepis.1